MCIIAIYEKGARPTLERVEYMMKRNPDGAGVAWNDGKQVHFRKGFTKPADVLAYVDSISAKANTIVFHARIATSGGVSAEKCHPYPVSANNKALNCIQGGGAFPVLFHNGVISLPLEKGLNDSQTFTKYALAPVYKRDPKGLARGVYDELLSIAGKGSRLALLYPDALKTYGEWTYDDGVTYSNTTYKPYEWKAYNYGGRYYDYGGYYDDGGGYGYAKNYGKGVGDYEKSNHTKNP